LPTKGIPSPPRTGYPGGVTTGSSEIEVGIIGDRDRSSPSHVATESALDHAAKALGLTLRVAWLPTRSLHSLRSADSGELLGPYDALWCAPGSPYDSTDGALAAIRFARESGRPLLGTCGGFQHTLLEYARNVAGIAAAEHAESSPTAAVPLISRLSCAIAGTRRPVRLVPGTATFAAYGEREVSEEFRCTFGLNPRYRDAVMRAPLCVSGVDENGEIRAAEIRGHAFFVGTLFLPQLSSSRARPHPLALALLRAATRFRRMR
jgi:CTP synthase (UTP-ammonia lyase)